MWKYTATIAYGAALANIIVGYALRDQVLMNIGRGLLWLFIAVGWAALLSSASLVFEKTMLWLVRVNRTLLAALVVACWAMAWWFTSIMLMLTWFLLTGKREMQRAAAQADPRRRPCHRMRLKKQS